MLRLLLLIGLLTGTIGLAASALDKQTLESLIALMKATSAAIRQSGLPASSEAANVVDKGAGGLREATARQETEAEVAGMAGNKQPVKKAFYNALPKECHWEKVIDPENGSVRCSIPERH